VLRPQLKPALRRVWRDAATIQLGLDPERAVVIGGLDEPATRLLDSLDGSRDIAGLQEAAAGWGLPPQRAGALIDLLHRTGALDDGAADHRPLRRLSAADRDRLAPDLAAASLVRAEHDGGTGVLARRQASVVAVHGAGRVGATLTSLLAAAAVGAVVVTDRSRVRLADVAPAGLPGEAEGLLRQDAAAAAARRIAATVRTTAPPRRDADLAVVTDEPDPGLPDELVRRGVPHLYVTVREGTGLVGPFVLPGRSACHRCLDLHRADRDPAWPRIAAQLRGPARQRVVACDVVLATAVAAQAALQVLHFVDGPAGADPAPAPLSVDGTVEVEQADGSVRRRSWSPHPLCGCRWRTHGEGGAYALD
jgi:hypothetical protein